jgi:hypothetical protein
MALMTNRNRLDYYTLGSIITVKSFIVQALEKNIKNIELRYHSNVTTASRYIFAKFLKTTHWLRV